MVDDPDALHYVATRKLLRLGDHAKASPGPLGRKPSFVVHHEDSGDGGDGGDASGAAKPRRASGILAAMASFGMRAGALMFMAPNAVTRTDRSKPQ